MSTKIQLKPGAFCWAEVMTRDTGAARAFYSELFGWQAQETPMGPDAAYTMFMIGDRPAAGMMALHGEMKDMHPCWVSHVYVTDLEQRVERARSLGGQLCKEASAGDMGRFAVIADPTGATFCMWQPNGPLGDAVYNEPGGLTWNELWTPDMEKAEKFYSGLFGWAAKPQDMGMPYTVFENEGRGNGGMMTLPEEAAKMGAPPNWLVYIGVDNTDATVAKAVALGAKMLTPPMDIPNVGRFSVLADPQGASFAVIKTTGPV